MVSRNHVSVKNPKSGFASSITDRTSSILGASDCVLVNEMFKSNSCPPCQGRQFTTKMLEALRPRCAVLNVRWRFWGPIAGTDGKGVTLNI